MHLVRFSLSYVGYRDRKEVASDLKQIYQAATLEEAEQQLERFEAKWQGVYPLIAQSCHCPVVAGQLGQGGSAVWLSG